VEREAFEQRLKERDDAKTRKMAEAKLSKEELADIHDHLPKPVLFCLTVAVVFVLVPNLASVLRTKMPSHQSFRINLAPV